MKRYSILLLSLLLSTLIQAQNITSELYGKLVDATSKEPIAFADLLLFEAGNTQPENLQLPDEKGSFSFKDIPHGNYSLMVRLIGYDLFTRDGIEISTENPRIDLGVIELKPLEVGLAEVNVVGSRRQVVYKLDKKVVDASTNLMGGGGTAIDILENTPSIRVDAEGEVTFRGSSGFAVYIDGKPSLFTGSQALEQVPAGQIENIEIITTPSARYDTEGDVGMINIITKKTQTEGLSGIINASGDTYGSYNLDFLLTQQHGKHRWYFGGNARERVRKSEFEQEKTTIMPDQLTTTSQSEGPRQGGTEAYTGKGGWNMTLPKGHIATDLEAGYLRFTRLGDLAYTETKGYPMQAAPHETHSYNSVDTYDRDEMFYQASISGEHRFNDEGHKITSSILYRFGDDALEFFGSDLFDLQGNRAQGHRAYEDEIRHTWRINMDYVFPYRETGRFEAGYQYHSYLEDGDYRMDYWSPDNKEFYDRTDIYNTFYFQEGVNSIYAILADSWNNFEAQAGVRGEHTHTVLRSSIQGADRLKNRFELFPSLHLGYTLPAQQRLMFSYSRRTTRPALFYMEPYITFRDFYTASIGNPDIRPEYINSFELNYKKDFSDNTISATLFHRSRTDKIERLRIPYEAGVTLDSMMNVGNDYSTGLELSTTLALTRWWNTTLNGNVYHYKLKNEHYAGGNEASSTNYDIRWNNTFNIAPTTRLQLDGNFVGPSVTTQGQTDSYWYVNLAIRQQFLDRRLSATLAWRDIFASARYNNALTTADLQSFTRIRPKYPQLMLTLSYSFNSYRDTKKGNTENGGEMFEGSGH